MTSPHGSAARSPERSHALQPGELPGLARTIARRVIGQSHAFEGWVWMRQEPTTLRTRSPGRPRAGWHAYRPAVGALLPSWAVEFALTIERPMTTSGGASTSRMLLLARAAGPWHSMGSAIGGAFREVDAIAGVGPPLPRLGLVRPHPEPGLHGLPRRVVLAHLRAASRRGHAVGYRRRHSSEVCVGAWRPGVGVALTCTGPDGLSAQAVVGIAGHGELPALRPPPGGATVLRAWRCHRVRKPRGPVTGSDAEWAFTAGVVLASPSQMGLGRVARRHAALAQQAGWDATVLTGALALEVARAGDPRYPGPRATARRASHASVAELLMRCIAAATDHADYPAPLST
jgi:hypothetical protein